jgi:hypothetical protein
MESHCLLVLTEFVGDKLVKLCAVLVLYGVAEVLIIVNGDASLEFDDTACACRCVSGSLPL